jgi:hypothetical protein
VWLALIIGETKSVSPYEKSRRKRLIPHKERLGPVCRLGYETFVNAKIKKSAVEQTNLIPYSLYIARSSNGRTTDSESVYLGSNPSLAADFKFFTSKAIDIKKV